MMTAHRLGQGGRETPSFQVSYLRFWAGKRLNVCETVRHYEMEEKIWEYKFLEWEKLQKASGVLD